MGARADRLNRVLLTLLGLLLLAAGVTGLLFGLGVLGQDVADRRILGPQVSRFVGDNAAWFWPVVALVALLLGLLALRWVLQQLRSDRVGYLDLTTERSRGETLVASPAVTEALVAATERCAGVDGASARLVEVRGGERLLLHVRLADRADVAETRQQLAQGPLSELRRTLGEQTCPDVRVELEPSTKGSSRVVA
jgi:hypothetical protein